MTDLISLIRADLTAMSEGETLSPARVLARTFLHARWRAVVSWRLAQRCVGRRATKVFGLWLTNHTLSFSGAELQPTAQIGSGLVLKHTTGTVVGGEVVAGERLTLHQNITLGDRRPFGGQPAIGDDVVVGAGACVLGPIRIGNRVQVAANSVVLTDVPDDCVVAGAPAQVVRRAAVNSPLEAPATLGLTAAFPEEPI